MVDFKFRGDGDCKLSKKKAIYEGNLAAEVKVFSFLRSLKNQEVFPNCCQKTTLSSQRA